MSDQESRDTHYSRLGADFLHRLGCEYCHKRFNGLELPSIHVKVFYPNSDGYELREMRDKAGAK